MPTPLIPSLRSELINDVFKRLAQGAPDPVAEISSPEDIPDIPTQVITPKLMALGKYRKLVEQLQAAADEPTTGIINFVTGAEASEPALINAILDEAFDPNRIYQNNHIDASLWGQAEARARFEGTIDGQPATMSEDEIQRRISFCQTSSGGTPAEINRCVARSLGIGAPVDLQDAQRRRTATTPRPVAGGAAAAFGAAPEAEAPNPLLEIFRLSDEIKALKSDRDKLVTRMSSEENADNSDMIRDQIEFIDASITRLRMGNPQRAGMPRMPSNPSEAVTDRSGFIHAAPYALTGLMGDGERMGFLQKIFHPVEAREEAEKQQKQNGQTLDNTKFDVLRFETVKKAVQDLTALISKSAGKKIGQIANQILSLLTSGKTGTESDYALLIQAETSDLDVNNASLVRRAREEFKLSPDQWNRYAPPYKGAAAGDYSYQARLIRRAILNAYLRNLDENAQKGNALFDQMQEIAGGGNVSENVLVLRNPHLSPLVATRAQQGGEAQHVFAMSPALRKLISNRDTFTCPKHTQVHSSKPGACPRCKADMEKGSAKSLVVVSPMPLVFEDANADVISMANTPVDAPEARVLIQEYFGRMNRWMSGIGLEAGQMKLVGTEERTLTNLLVGRSYPEAKRVIHNNLAAAVFRISKAYTDRQNDQDRMQGRPITVGRILKIQVPQNEALNAKATVEADGNIEYTPLGRVQVNNLSAAQAATNIQTALRKKHENVTVTVGIEIPANSREIFDGEEFVRGIRKQNNERARKEAHGAESSFTFFERTEITWPEYNYDHTSDFGKAVGTMEKLVKQAQDCGAAVIRIKASLRDASDRLRAMVKPAANATPEERQTFELSQAQLSVKVRRFSHLVLKAQEDEHAAMAQIPHFIILYGEPGVGKTVFAHALANLGRFQFTQVKFETATGPYVGQHELHTEAALKSILAMSDSVLLMDEFDGAGANRSSMGANDPNQHHKGRASLMLNFFGDSENKTRMRDRNIFIVATTNNGGALRGALRERAALYEVPRPDSPAAIRNLLGLAVDQVGRNLADTIQCIEGVTDQRGKIEILKRYWNVDKIDFDAIAAVLFKTGINPRRLGEWCNQAMCEMAKYLSWQEKIALYQKAQNDPDSAEEYYLQYGHECDYDAKTRKVTAKPGKEPQKNGAGFPLNTSTLLYAARKTKVQIALGDGTTTDNDCQWKENGVMDLGGKFWSNPDVIKEQVTEEVGPEQTELYKDYMNPDVMQEESSNYPDIPMSGQTCTICGSKVFAGEGGNATCPNCGELRKRKAPGAPGAAKALPTPAPVVAAPAAETAATRSPVAPTAPINSPGKKKSSTDYYFSILANAGLVKEAQAPVPSATPQNSVPKPGVSESVYDYNGILLMPVRRAASPIQ